MFIYKRELISSLEESEGVEFTLQKKDPNHAIFVVMLELGFDRSDTGIEYQYLLR